MLGHWITSIHPRSAHLAGYDRRKYVWKLLYIYMLGYDIPFGHKQAADLIPLPKWVQRGGSLLLTRVEAFHRFHHALLPLMQV